MIKNLSVTIPRILLGLVFTAFGLLVLLKLAPTPPHEGIAAQYLGALATTYVLTLVKLTEVAAGLALLTNRFVPLALTVLAPITLNILGFHTLIEPGGFALPVLMTAAHLWLAWKYRAAFAPMLKAKVQPEVASAAPVGRSVTA
jgi:putative oxidoreductase